MRGIVWHVYHRTSRQEVFLDTRREAFAWVAATFADPTDIIIARCGPDDDYIIRDFRNSPRRVKAKSA